MADFYTNQTEENLIYRVIKDGLGFESESEIPKYLILRLALALALRLESLPLDSHIWAEKTLNGGKGKEYHLEQLTGKDKGENEDMDLYIGLCWQKNFTPIYTLIYLAMIRLILICLAKISKGDFLRSITRGKIMTAFINGARII